MTMLPRQMPAPRGLSYREALLSNIMDTDGMEWPEAPFRPSLGMSLQVLKKVSPLRYDRGCAMDR
jgi:hypothetical protein